MRATTHVPFQAVVLAACAFAACDMPSAETLDHPRVLALRSEPANLVSDRPTELSALVFDVPELLAWSLCADAWVSEGPGVACPSGALDLGRGNPLVVTLPAGLESAWILAAPVDGEALPAVKRIEVASAEVVATNPEVSGLLAPDAPLTTLTSGETRELRVELGASSEAEAERLVVSWYTTAGTIDPGRTLASEPATLVAPNTSNTFRVIAVVREVAGGIGWAEADVTIGGATP